MVDGIFSRNLMTFARTAGNATVFRKKELQDELHKLEERQIAIAAEIEACILAQNRPNQYNPVVGDFYICPDCYVGTGKNVMLLPQAGNDQQDFFLCRDCGREYIFKL